MTVNSHQLVGIASTHCCVGRLQQSEDSAPIAPDPAGNRIRQFASMLPICCGYSQSMAVRFAYDGHLPKQDVLRTQAGDRRDVLTGRDCAATH